MKKKLCRRCCELTALPVVILGTVLCPACHADWIIWRASTFECFRAVKPDRKKGGAS